MLQNLARFWRWKCMATKKSYFLILILITTISFSGCGIMGKNKTSGKLTLKDIAFDVNKDSGYTVYIKESSKYVPYLVLTSNYNGNALLLRKEVLEEDHIFNKYIGYYRESLIDKFLNSEFLSTLDPEIKNNIINTEITITKESSLGIAGTDTENIKRKVFLLSCTEVGIDDISFLGEEGKALEYFNDAKSRIAYSNVMARGWWLRTSYTIYESAVWVIDAKGVMDGGGAYERSGIRPAFCLSNTKLIEKNNNVIAGKTVYVIAY